MRAGLDTVVLPERNRRDLDEIPPRVKKALTFHLVKTMGEVVELALLPLDVDA